MQQMQTLDTLLFCFMNGAVTWRKKEDVPRTEGFSLRLNSCSMVIKKQTKKVSWFSLFSSLVVLL